VPIPVLSSARDATSVGGILSPGEDNAGLAGWLANEAGDLALLANSEELVGLNNPVGRTIGGGGGESFAAVESSCGDGRSDDLGEASGSSEGRTNGSPVGRRLLFVRHGATVLALVRGGGNVGRSWSDYGVEIDLD